MLYHVRRFTVTALACLLVALPVLIFRSTPVVHAAAGMSLSNSANVVVGDAVNITVRVSASESVNSFEGTFTYPTALFEGVRGSYSGSICTLPIVQPDPSGGSATFSCGRPGGFSGTGTVATITLEAKSSGTATFGLTGCTVLANDGAGTDVSGGCSGSSITVNAVVISTPTPTAAPNPTATPAGGPAATNTPRATATPRTSSTPRPTPTPDTRPGTAQESANPVVPTQEPISPDTVPVASAPPTPTLPPITEAPEAVVEGRRNIGQAFGDVFTSLRNIGQLGSNLTGVIALLITLIPVLALLFGLLLLGYRMYNLERKRRRTLDRLFEMELAELAALEGKMDLLAEKGNKGREQYKEEFQKAKENILRQLRPDYGKPVSKEEPTDKPAETPAA